MLLLLSVKLTVDWYRENQFQPRPHVAYRGPLPPSTQDLSDLLFRPYNFEIAFAGDEVLRAILCPNGGVGFPPIFPGYTSIAQSGNGYVAAIRDRISMWVLSVSDVIRGFSPRRVQVSKIDDLWRRAGAVPDSQFTGSSQSEILVSWSLPLLLYSEYTLPREDDGSRNGR